MTHRTQSTTFWPTYAPQALALSFHGERLAEARQGKVFIYDTGTSEVTGLHGGYAHALAFPQITGTLQ